MKLRDVFLLLGLLCAVPSYATTTYVDLGSAAAFVVLGGSTVTNTGSTNITGDIGASPGTAITGFPPGIVNGVTHGGDPTSLLAETDLATAYSFAAGEPCADNLSGQDLGGLTLSPGVYCFSSSAQLTGTLTLDGGGDSGAVFVFQVGSTLVTASDSSVVFSNGGEGYSVFWQVGSSATLGADTSFAGSILALTSISLGTGATIECGRALAQNGAVTLDTNVVSIGTPGCDASSRGSGSVPEPGTAALLATGAFFLIGGMWVKRGLASCRRDFVASPVYSR